MKRDYMAAAAQLGPIAKDEPRSSAVARMICLLHEAKACGAEVVVFPELALTTFFPRWFFENEAQLETWYETQMPNKDVQPLFDAAAKLNIGFYLGYAELAVKNGKRQRFNTSIIVDGSGQIVGKYRKIHLPGHFENEPWRPFQHLEKRYFEPGNLGFPVFEAFGGKVGMCICNDRRWPETFRVMGLRGAELIMLGYNTPRHYPLAPEHDHLQDFHNHLCMQAGAYANGSWIIATAKAGLEENCDLIGGSCIIAPTGEIVAKAQTSGDELVIARVKLDRCRELRENVFNFALHRQPGEYGDITARV